MCRFVAYFGKDKILLDELLEKPENSLIKQSHAAREGKNGVNADGFGVSWYEFDINGEPGIFKSTQPAWNNNNLKHISKKIAASAFLGHVRASTIGDVVENNCHPFAFKNYSFVHNGTIRNFDHIKRKLFNKISDALFLSIKGNTDSECFFHLIMHFIEEEGLSLIASVKCAIDWIVKEQKPFNETEFSRINIVITNGEEILATRFVSKGEDPLSFHYSVKELNNQLHSITLSSEILNQPESLWEEVPENSYLYINRDAMKLEIDRL